MNEHVREDRLHDYVDDLLCREERIEVELHLNGCEQCRSEVAALRDLVSSLHGVPESIEPSSDLLAGIHARLDEMAEPIHSPAVRTLSGRTLHSMRGPLAAAAVLLVALSAILTATIVRRPAPDADTRTTSNRSTDSNVGSIRLAGSQHDAVEKQYRDATSELEAQLAAQREFLSAETVQLVEENLRVIDTALSEARTALQDDPGNPMLSDLVRSAYEQKLDLLRNATAVRGDT